MSTSKSKLITTFCQIRRKVSEHHNKLGVTSAEYKVFTGKSRSDAEAKYNAYMEEEAKQ